MTVRMTRHVLAIYLILAILHRVVLPANGGKILIRPLIGDGSHYMVASAIASEIVNRGHNVTMLVQDIYEDKVKASQDISRYQFVFYRSNFTLAEMVDYHRNMTRAGLRGKFFEWLVTMKLTTNRAQRVQTECLNLMTDVVTMTALRHANYDVTLSDGTFMASHCPIMQYLGRPYAVLFPSLSIPSPLLFAARVPFNPSYMPEVTTAFDQKMSYLTRLTNTLHEIFVSVIMNYFSTKTSNADEFFDDNINDIFDVSRYFSEADLWLINTHFALDFPKPLSPHMVTVGGLTTTEPRPLNHVSQI